jgi:hypothetical protein
LLLRCNVYNYYSENATYTKFTEDIPAKRNNFTTASSIVEIQVTVMNMAIQVRALEFKLPS